MPAIPLIVVGSVIASVLFGWNSWISVKLIDTSENLFAVKETVTTLNSNFTEYIIKPALQDRSKKNLPVSIATTTEAEADLFPSRAEQKKKAPLITGVQKGGEPQNEHD